MEKAIADKDIMAQILDALDIKAHPFSQNMEGVHRNVIYNILAGGNYNISPNIRKKILETYPNINPEFLKNGVPPVLLNTGSPVNHNLNIQPNDSLLNLQRLINIEVAQQRIESKLDQLLNLLSTK